MNLSTPVILEIFSVCLIALLLLNRGIAIFWGQILSECYPAPLLSGIIGGCMLLIAFVISFHSNVFTENDRYNIVRNQQNAKGNGYNWIDLEDVFRFPIDQLVLERYFFKANLFDFSPKVEIKQNYHLIIVDKTKSTNENEDSKKLLVKAKKILKDEIEKISIESGRTLDKLTSFADIIAISCAIDAIVQGKSKITIGFYRGRDNIDSRSMDYISYDVIKETLDSFIKRYYNESIRPYNHKYSDFAQLFEDTAHKGLAYEQRKDKDVLLTIISDFNHDYQYYDGEKLIDQLNFIGNSNVKQINSFVLKRSNIPDTDNNVINAIKQAFVQKSWLEICNEKELCEDTQNHLINIITNPNKPLGNEQEVSALRFFDNPYNLRSSKATIYLINNKKPCEGEITVSLKSSYLGEEMIVNSINIGDKNIILALNDYKTSSFPDGKVDLIFPKQLSESDEYYLHIYSKDHKKKITTSIVFREQLTNTSSIILVFLYSLLYSASAALLGILAWGDIYYLWTKSTVYWKLGVGTAVVTFFIIPVFYILYISGYNIYDLFNYQTDLAKKARWASILPFSFVVLLIMFNVKNIHLRLLRLV